VTIRCKLQRKTLDFARISLVVSSVAALSALLCACGSGNSTNDMTARQATAALNEYFAGNPETGKVLTGMNNIGAQPLSEHWETPDGKYQKALEAAGLETITPKGKIFNPANHNQFMFALDIKLTERGKRMVRGKPLIIPAPSANTWDTVYENAVFCTKQVMKITSISTIGDTARADYSFESASFTPFYDAYHLANPTDPNTCSTKPQDSTASFERKNGVWAISTP
jgi:hypothetical protein